MSYKDFFNGDYTSDAPIVEDEMQALPEYEGVTAGANSNIIGSAEPLSFDGFVTRQPLLVERPTRFVHRVTEALRALLIIPDDDKHNGVDGRTMLSPAVVLPYPILFGNEQYPSEDVFSYPLIHQPRNKQYDGETPLEEYLLTLIAFYQTQNIMTETDTGNLVAYPLPEPFEADEQMWAECEDWARSIRQPLTDLNVARLVGFSVDRMNEEQDTLIRLLDMWNIQGTARQIIDKGAEAQEAVGKLYHRVYPDIEFLPFHE